MYLGLDLGTSGVRALLVREDGTVIGEGASSLDAQHPQPGWSEQDPADWVRACELSIAALVQANPDAVGALKGIGISGQMHGAVLLDESGAVLRPCILWNDTRAAEQAARLDAAPGFREITGNIVFPGFTAPKIDWVAEHEPEIFQRIHTVLLPKDYLVFWLTGLLASDMSDASGTAWLDTRGRSWSQPLLAASAAAPGWMPKLHEGSDVVGPVRGDLARALGLPDGVAVVAGGADNAASACGVGALDTADGFVSLGTSGVIMGVSEYARPLPESALHTFCHAVPGKWYQMGVMLAATDSLNWLSRITGAAPKALTAPLGDSLGEAGTIRFLPYLSGERTPHNDATIRGAFSGLDIAHTRDDMVRAVLEGVAFGLRDGHAALLEAGVRPGRLLAIGGGTGSRYWVELLATVLGVPLDLPQKGEFGAALGAARLAICGVGGYSANDIMTKPPIAETIDPRPDLIPGYEDAYAAFRALYPAIRPVR